MKVPNSTISPSEVSIDMASAETMLPGFDIDEMHTGNGEGYLVVVYNNEKNTYDEVVMILQKATHCSLEEAKMETWEVDHLGKSVVHMGGRDICEQAASIIRTIGIHVEVVEE